MGLFPGFCTRWCYPALFYMDARRDILKMLEHAAFHVPNLTWLDIEESDYDKVFSGFAVPPAQETLDDKAYPLRYLYDEVYSYSSDLCKAVEGVSTIFTIKDAWKANMEALPQVLDEVAKDGEGTLDEIIDALCWTDASKVSAAGVPLEDVLV